VVLERPGEQAVGLCVGDQAERADREQGDGHVEEEGLLATTVASFVRQTRKPNWRGSEIVRYLCGSATPKQKGCSMRFVRQIGLVLIGVVIGILLAGSMQANQSQGEKTSRLSFIDVGTNNKTSTLTFIKDHKSGGCWLGVDSRGQGISSLAVAPAEACSQ
jgi:hypothetical protein